MPSSVHDLRARSALQQPVWEDAGQVRRVRETLAAAPPLVTGDGAARLRRALTDVAEGRAHLIQAGDCAEDPAESTPYHVRRKSALIDALAGTAAEATGRPVLRIGRIAGQFAKPRSKPVEQIGDVTLPVYRGHMVNAPEADARARRPDPSRILTCLRAARSVVRELDAVNSGRADAERVWISHEALLLDYELPMLRHTAADEPYLASAHLPWVGERTRQPGGAHIALLAGIVNPVACKIGSGTTAADITELAARLDPARSPGRLVFIARMGAGFVTSRLPALVRAVRAAGHPAVWICDPMHGNTITGPDGQKTRLMDTMRAEIEGFCDVLDATGGTNGGLHLETTPDLVAECATDMAAIGSAGRRTSFCDPRLNPGQAHRLVAAWAHRAR
ncbi:3-deoxy-7-phosphoheptulonate synthase [Streptomyces sp. WMMC500]|uniref:3-deoxy-7-phosphoheptulonate synthase n=1 Tax=Streptomyces sp. WMMC500 TaxID=3015154 RepID=UPI00248B50F5|nr:3-deoxy-7-phosphoheptulonate synthase [Streptomyces sp. WMMC500]WBB61652.1 3-deoxy-7-phosphoheptulonate synthase [Streptomyces sp. WMMC500]